MKRTRIRKTRNTPLKRTSFQNKVGIGVKPKKPAKRKKRAKKPTLRSIRIKCDKLLSPIVKKNHPTCLLCPNPTQVAHHHVHKSTSNVLRYYLPNLINLCNHCHLVLHNNESYWASKIVQLKGLEWFADLEKRKGEIVKVDRFWYEEHHANLLKEYESYT